MSRFIHLIFYYFISAMVSTISYADGDAGVEDPDKGTNSEYGEFVGMDMSEFSKEQLIPALEGIELPEDRPLNVTVVPIKMGIGKPSLFLLRRAVKNALENSADVLVLEMDTPGGGVMEALEMMEILNEFPGITITFINDEAISAGAIISSVTDYIYFSPLGIMGSAAAIQMTGEEIGETMQAKLYSYLDARIESYSLNKRLRNKVLKAMIDKDFEFVEDGILISPKDKLLALTAPKAFTLFGDPPEPLVAAGIVETVDEIFQYGFQTEEVEITEFEQTWSEEVASHLVSITPLLYGLGFVMLVIEIKTPSFGVLGALGALFIVTAFFGQDVAGLAGFEAVLLLLGGIVLIAVEVFILPGTVIFGLTGILCVLGAMVWSFADVWPVVPVPGEAPTDWRINTGSIESGIYNVALGLIIAGVLLWVIWRILPKTSFYKKIVHLGTVAEPSLVVSGGGRYVEETSLPDIGSEGVVVTDLHPVGVVEVAGDRYEATTSVGDISRGETILIVGYRSYSLLVDKKN